MSDLGKLFAIVVAGLAIVGLGVMLGPAPINAEKKVSEENVKYSIVTIEGMPCLITQSHTYPNNTVVSATCDWSKWDGNK